MAPKPEAPDGSWRIDGRAYGNSEIAEVVAELADAHAWSMYPKGCGGSSPLDRTNERGKTGDGKLGYW